jgi:alpha-D-xyloside xylohydrolase
MARSSFDGRRLTLEFRGAPLVITPYGESVIHVAWYGKGRPAGAGEAPMWGISGEPSASVRAEVEEGPATTTFRLPGVSATLRESAAGGELSFYGPDGELLTALADIALSKSPREAYRLDADFAAQPGEAAFGLGQHQNGLMDQAGREVKVWHDYDAPGGESVGVPFMVSSRRYGLLFDNPSRITVGPLQQATGAAQPAVGLRRWSCEVADYASFFVIAGRSFDDIYSGYRALSGATPIPPRYAFGLWQSKERYKSQDELLEVARKYREKGLPCDLLVVDYYHWPHTGDWHVDEKAWPDLAGMCRTLRQMGFRTMFSIWPRVAKESENWELFYRNKWFMLAKDGEPATDGDPRGPDIDTTIPECADFLWGKLRENYVEKGVDSYWLDETEPDIPPLEHRFSIGSGARLHNLYPLIHTGAVYDRHRAAYGTRCLILSRAAYTGAQRNGTSFWSSDIPCQWDVLKRQVPCALNFVASGMPYWSSDIGGWHHPDHPLAGFGYGREEFAELYLRWYQFGAFCPTFRTHGRRPNGNEPWSFGPEAEAIIAKYLRLRYRLLPYLYSCARRTYLTGSPFMRPLFMDFPDDPRAAETGDEYMLGPSLLVAPVTDKGATCRSVRLPAGRDWLDFWTGRRYAGGQDIVAEAPLDTLPLFAPAGSIIPLGEVVPSADIRQRELEVLVFPGADASFDLYDDDGTSYAYERGECREIALRWDERARRLEASDEGALTEIFPRRNVTIRG